MILAVGASDEDMILGYAHLVVRVPGEAQLNRLYVDAGCRGTGLAGRLLDALRGECRRRGKMEQAISWTRRALTLDPDDPITNYNAASVYSVSGDQETALRFLEVYIRQSSQDIVGLVSNDEDLAGVREHPGFRELLAGNWSR